VIIKSIPANFSDDRGQITDIIENQPVDSITLLSTKKDAIRGNHYHAETTQYLYILEGSCNYHSQKDDAAATVEIATKGDLIITPPLEHHAFEALEDSLFLAFCHGPRGGTQYETDTFRLENPLCKPKNPALT
jgi:quercetin dioxygenase-like cupin family protein